MYPISFAADHEAENRNRLTTFFRYFLNIPLAIVALIWSIGVWVTWTITFLVMIFTGRYPQGMYDFNGRFLRFGTRVNGYSLLMTDQYPAFNGEPDDSYPIRVGIAEPKPQYSRMKALFRGIVGIPVMLLAFVQGLIGSVVALLAWFQIVFTGRFSDGLYDPLRAALAYQTRANAYFLLMTEDYPPFSYDPQVEQAQVGGAQAPALGTPQAQREEPPPPPSS
jgi:hypothetical protein